MNINSLFNRFKNGESLTKLSQEINISRETLTKKFIKECGYKRKSKNNTKNSINEQILEKSYFLYKDNGFSLSQIANLLNINRKSLSKKLKQKYDINIRPAGAKECNDFCFSNITYDSAYWLGIMLTDGYVDKGNGFELSLKDKEHIEKFKNFLNSKHIVQEKKILCNNKECIAYRISINNTQIVSDLNNLNCTNNKSFDVRLPNIEEKYIPSLIRGIFDGDGCLTLTKTNRKALSICSASKDFLNDIASCLKKNNIKVTRIYKSRNLYNLNISVKRDNFYSFFNYIYKDSNDNNRLKRKYEKYKAALPS